MGPGQFLLPDTVKKAKSILWDKHSHKGTSLRFEKLEDSILRGIKSQYVFIPLEHIIQA